MKKSILKGLLLAVGGVALSAGNTMALNWVQSPDGAFVMGDTIAVGTVAGDLDSQTQGIYGAGFTTSNYVNVLFDTNLHTWDSYSMTGDPSGDGGSKGWWDVFVVNINQTDYYWNLGYTDPIVDDSYAGGYGIFDNSVLPGATWAFGGEDYGNGTLESEQSFPAQYTLSLDSYDPLKPVYVSLVLDTKTNPDSDTAHPSYGSFQVGVEPVPEPATMLLFGTGLVSLGFVGSRRRKTKK